MSSCLGKTRAGCVVSLWLILGACSFDTTNSIRNNGNEIDARPVAVDAAPPIDAIPVECSRDIDCATPPNLCFVPGSCNLDTNTCSFPNVQCQNNETCMTYACNASNGVCEPTAVNEAAVCLPQSCGAFGTCQFDNINSCDETGTESQQCSESFCSSGTCAAVTTTVSQDCFRSTTNDECDGGTTCGNFNACQFGSECDQEGTQSRTCTDRVCGNGVCETATRTESQSCSRVTDGNDCSGGTTCGNFDVCGGFSDDCDESGMQSRTCTDRVCSAGSCGVTDRIESQNCTRGDTDGNSCGTQSCDTGTDAGSGSQGLCCSADEVCNVVCGTCE